MPAFNLKQLLEDDKTRKDSFGTKTVRYGKPFDVNYSLLDGEWNDMDKGRLWSMTFESDGAHSLNFLLEGVYLPHGAYIFIVNEEETVLYGNITSAVVNETGIVLTDLIPGAKSTIYLFEPESQKGKSRMMITKVIHGIRDVAMDGIAPEDSEEEMVSLASSCNIDIACKPAYSNEANAVALIYDHNGYK